MRTRRLFFVALIGLAWLSGCSRASPGETATGSAEPIPPSACAAIDLRSPSGNTVDLTGRWRSPGGIYYLRQVGSCVWFVGLSADTGAPGGEDSTSWTNAFLGTLTPDFTFEGAWADVPWGTSEGAGEVTWRIGFTEVEGVEAVTLEAIESSGGFGGRFLVLPESEVDLTVHLGESDECVTVVSDQGQDYELALTTPGWSVGTPIRLFGPHAEQILPADPFRITGEVARGSGFCGPGRILFDESIEPQTTS
jgi:hypothetical protein